MTTTQHLKIAPIKNNDTDLIQQFYSDLKSVPGKTEGRLGREVPLPLLQISGFEFIIFLNLIIYLKSKGFVLCNECLKEGKGMKWGISGIHIVFIPETVSELQTIQIQSTRLIKLSRTHEPEIIKFFLSIVYLKTVLFLPSTS